MPLHAVAQAYELSSHSLHEILLQYTLRMTRRLAAVQHFLGHILLFLKHRKPACVEFVPQLDSITMELLLVSYQT